MKLKRSQSTNLKHNTVGTLAFKTFPLVHKIYLKECLQHPTFPILELLHYKYKATMMRKLFVDKTKHTFDFYIHVLRT